MCKGNQGLPGWVTLAPAKIPNLRAGRSLLGFTLSQGERRKGWKGRLWKSCRKLVVEHDQAAPRAFLARLSFPESKLGGRAVPATCGIRIAARSLRPVLSWPVATAAQAGSRGACGVLPPRPTPTMP